jgi:hypothetical protein
MSEPTRKAVVGDRIRFSTYDCEVKEIVDDQVRVYNTHLGEFPLPRIQLVSNLNVAPAKPAAVDGDYRCRVCGSTYPNTTQAEAQAAHTRDMKCNGKVSKTTI